MSSGKEIKRQLIRAMKEVIFEDFFYQGRI